jgi:hypothetical protein
LAAAFPAQAKQFTTAAADLELAAQVFDRWQGGSDLQNVETDVNNAEQAIEGITGLSSQETALIQAVTQGIEGVLNIIASNNPGAAGIRPASVAAPMTPAQLKDKFNAGATAGPARVAPLH